MLFRSLEKDRARRYESANGFASDLQRYLADEIVEARPASTSYRLKKFVRRHKGQVIAASLVLGVLLAGIAGTTVGLLRAENARVAESKQREVAEENERKAVAAVEGERLAKLYSQENEKLATAAAAAEKAAKLDANSKQQEAERNLAFAKKGNDILGLIFVGLDPQAKYATVAELRNALRDNLTKAVKELDGSAIGDPLEVATMQNTLGLSLLSLGEANLAIELFGKAFATHKERQGADHFDTLASMNNLALAYEDIGKMDKALPLKEETLKLLIAKLGADHHGTLRSMSNLAQGYQAIGKMDKALPLKEETLKLMIAKLGADHPDTLTSMSNLAQGYQAIGKMDKALPLMEETLKLMAAKLGADHPDTLKAQSNLALCYQDAGKMDKALPLMEETLKLRAAKLGADHPDTLVSMGNLAGGYQDVGKMDKALPLMEETFKLTIAKLGADHPDTLRSMNNLAQGYRAIGKMDKALPLMEETLKLMAAKLGADHPDTLVSLCNLAGGYQAIGKMDKALPLFEQTASEVEKRRFQLDVAKFIIRDTIVAYEEAKQFDKAEAWQRKWLVVEKANTGATSPAYAGELAGLGLLLLKQQKWIEAEPILRECLAIREKTQPDAWTTFNTQSMLGGALLGQKKHIDAEPLLLAGYEGIKVRFEKTPGADVARLAMAKRLPESVDRLIELYTAINKPDEVKKWRTEHVKYMEIAPPPRLAK